MNWKTIVSRSKCKIFTSNARDGVRYIPILFIEILFKASSFRNYLWVFRFPSYRRVLPPIKRLLRHKSATTQSRQHSLILNNHNNTICTSRQGWSYYYLYLNMDTKLSMLMVGGMNLAKTWHIGILNKKNELKELMIEFLICVL